MRILEYADAAELIDPEMTELVGSILWSDINTLQRSSWVEKLIEDYTPEERQETQDEVIRNNINGQLYKQLLVVFTLLGNNLKGKKVLDLGCGSNGGIAEYNRWIPEEFQPWLCRALQRLGALPIGVDVGDISTESFEAYNVDLLEPGILANIIPAHSIDLVNSTQLFNSPELEKRTTGLSWGHGSPEIGENLASILYPQIERLLIPGGAFVYYADLTEYHPTISERQTRYQRWPFGHLIRSN